MKKILPVIVLIGAIPSLCPDINQDSKSKFRTTLVLKFESSADEKAAKGLADTLKKDIKGSQNSAVEDFEKDKGFSVRLWLDAKSLVDPQKIWKMNFKNSKLTLLVTTFKTKLKKSKDDVWTYKAVGSGQEFLVDQNGDKETLLIKELDEMENYLVTGELKDVEPKNKRAHLSLTSYKKQNPTELVLYMKNTGG